MATRVEHQPMPREGGVNKIVAAGIVAGAIGIAAFGAYELSQNGTSGNKPEATPPAGGGIVEPSNSPIPTQVSPTENIVIPSASPSATPEATPTPTETQKVMPTMQEVESTILNQPDSSVKAVKISKIKTDIQNIWKKYNESIVNSGNNPLFSDPKERDPQKQVIGLDWIMRNVTFMEKGAPGLSENEITGVKKAASSDTTVGFLLVYRGTNNSSLKSALMPIMDEIYDYGSLVAGRANLDEYRKSMEKSITGSLSFFPS